MKFNPPDYLFVYILLQIILHFFAPIKQVIFYPYIFLGLPLILFGLYLNWIHVPRLFKKSKTHFDVFKEPKAFVTNGFFKISRNPTYLGMFLALIGVAIMFGSVSTIFPATLFWILVNFITVPKEEANLEKAFGKKYINYKKKVRRWL